MKFIFLTRVISMCLIFVFFCNVLHAQNDLTEEWEMQYLQRQPPDKILAAIGVEKGMVIGEIGAGRGRFTVYMAREVGPSGKIYANDIDEKALSYLKGRAARQGFKNIETIRGRGDDPRFPDNSLDMAVMVLVFHMLENPNNLLKNIKNGLRPGANLIIIDPVDRLIDGEFGVDRSKPGEHPPTIKERIEKSAMATGYKLIRTETFLPDDYIFILKPADNEKNILAADVIRDKILESGIDEGIKLFDVLKTDTLHYNLAEQTFLNLGYEFYGRRTLPVAIAALNMGIDLYPKSWELHYSLGEMYLIYGDKEKSRGSFKLSLEYNPSNQSAEYVLKNLDEIFDQTHPKKEFIFAQPGSPVQAVDSFIKTEKLNDKTILVQMGYDAVTAIETQKGIVVIDAGISTGLTSKYRKIIENEFEQDKIAYLINTHGHPDHTGGNTVFADAVILGHDNCPEEISKQWQDPEKVKSSLNKIVNDYDNELQSLVPGTNEWNNVFCQKTRYQYAYNDVLSNCSVTKPNVTFFDSLDLDMGDVKFNLFYFGIAHSESDIMVHIPEMKILMVGDLFSRYGRPGFNVNKNQNGERRVKVTKWIEKILPEIDIIIDGHGQILSKDDLQAFNSLIKKMQIDK